ncbi:3-isopropylmalate dehydrogenase [Clostridium sp. MCC353]|uniref:3-isopropylmalate dehydrogenase n=1 Tax=Clostridium sp. MCC353 TaxID=2592646 RepID=UPI001C020753|nr:3-isopropylmalate dehydrogenase [Clostridium sp. MCC353]MBT9776372.1 3-isopropylmalate dehydrogenase [Clostridium sp. MCC353]
MEEKPLQWHAAFQAALQFELMEDREFLQFLKEYNLSEKPLQIDTLIIKLEPGRKVKKSLGRIFRQYNVVEYKSPSDYLSVNDFYKVMGYACLYQSDTEKVMEIRPEDLTVTLISSHYPREMIRYLGGQYGITVTSAYPGIYYVEGLLFPIQILVTKNLSKEEHVWLSRLRCDLEIKKDIEPLARAYEGKQKNPLYAAVMDLIIRANRKQYEEGKKMCEALRELFADELEQGVRHGVELGMEKGIQAMILDNMEEGVTAERICEKLQRRFELTPEKAREYIDKYGTEK